MCTKAPRQNFVRYFIIWTISHCLHLSFKVIIVSNIFNTVSFIAFCWELFSFICAASRFILVCTESNEPDWYFNFDSKSLNVLLIFFLTETSESAINGGILVDIDCKSDIDSERVMIASLMLCNAVWTADSLLSKDLECRLTLPCGVSFLSELLVWTVTGVLHLEFDTAPLSHNSLGIIVETYQQIWEWFDLNLISWFS